MDKERASLYRVWHNMMRRCYQETNKKYFLYGGRGIKVCQRWHKFENFFSDMAPRPDGLTLERVKNNRGYSPKNCKWATYSEQMRNRRMTVWLRFRGERLCLTDMAKKYGIRRDVLGYRLLRGWPVKQALLTPPSLSNSYFIRKGMPSSACSTC